MPRKKKEKKEEEPLEGNESEIIEERFKKYIND